jgi:hypothetical protein
MSCKNIFMDQSLITYPYLSKDKFGFYQIDDFKSYSKVETIEAARKINKPNSVYWNFNDHEFSNYNWKIEPAESIKQLYQHRARQIRERYDYVVIWWSGGADSYTMLKAFVDEGLFVDELATFHNHTGDGNWDSYLNSEVKQVAIPLAEKILENSPNTKFRLVDHFDYQPDLYNVDDNKFDFLYKANAVFSPNQLARRYIREKEKDYLDLFAQGKKVCFVWGMDKPRITQVNGKYAMLFVDILDNCVNPETQRLDRAWENDEFFYWSPDSCDLLCKQGHIVKNYLRNVPQHDIDAGWLTTNSNVLGGTKINGQMYYLTNNGLHRLIYPDWDTNTYSSGKHELLLMWSPRDDWFLKDEHSEHRKIYTNGLEKLKELVGPEWTSMKGIMHGLVRSRSKLHLLE